MSEAKDTPGQVILSWWGRRLNRDTGAARKARAQLRRATSPLEVLTLDVTHDLHGHLGINLARGDGPRRLALVAATVAGLDSSVRASLPRRFGEKDGDNPRLSPMRFECILRAGDDWELAIRLRRALPIVGRTANVAGLGADLLRWGEDVRTRWCFDYFGAAPPDAPDADDAPDASEPSADHQEG
ncbi:MAG: type I-E CRISPR-associated protein Cse2/CasB [Pseudomonadota bacterium]